MGKVIDLSNQTFGQLKVLKRGENTKRNYATWECQCLCGCGKIVTVRSDQLRQGLRTDCGRSKQRKIKIDYTGKQFENYAVIKRGDYGKWECLTDDDQIIFKTSTELSKAKKYYNDKDKDNDLKIQQQNNKYIRSLYHNIKNASEGEFVIAMILIQNNIYFEMEHIFTDLKSEKCGYYRYDFFVDNRYIIEYDGEQHYKESDFFRNSLNEIQKSDKIKTEYCQANNIPIIRIPYMHLNKIQLYDLLPETSSFLI